MFENIGSKIKTLAQAIAILGSSISIAFGFWFISKGIVSYALIYIFLGPLLSWVSSFALYAFGQLVENSDETLKVRKKKYLHDREYQSRLVAAVEKLAGVKTEDAVNGKLKNEKKEKKEIIPEIKQESIVTVELMNKVTDLLSELSDDDIKELKKTFKSWHKEIIKFTTEEIVDELNKTDNWKSPYIVLCCIELKERS